ncbi:MAG TPA: vitamin B12 dependent methionine synthase [Clostridia bacterium]|jgi:hypothetical protein|nr:vitamin B12 dependent methionine synthase [Clostridia bacterium]
MEIVLLDKIPFEIDREQFYQKLRINNKPYFIKRAEQMIEEALAVARPKAMYREAFIKEKGEDYVVIEGLKFISSILRINLGEVYKVYPYIATSGVEIEEWSKSKDSMLEIFWADVIKELALASASKALLTHFREHVYDGLTSTMNPGSLKEWPISEQENLFALLGNPREAIGVELNESFLMTPVKSVSGIRFQTDVKFENCQLCPRKGCPGRKAPYDKKLHEEKYLIKLQKE